MKKYLVIGNPIDHSLSPELHNRWIKENNIDAVYDKIQLNANEIKKVIRDIKTGKIEGINVTVPFKKSIISYLDELEPLAKETQSVNTIFKTNNKIVGDNTDVFGFEKSLKNINYEVKNKKVFILGAGGVVPSVIVALKRLGVKKITLSNRTKEKAEDLKKKNPNLEVINWGESTDFDMIINATSLGLKKNDEINLNYSDTSKKKLFYDIIYNPIQTNFILKAKQFGHKTQNGRMMFVYQAQLAFKIWHNILPKINNELLN